MKPVLYIMCGYPFSGKSTLAKQLEEKLGFKRINIGKIQQELNTMDDQQVFAEMDRKIIDYLRSGVSVTVDAPNLTRANRNKLRNLAVNEGFSSKVIFIDTPLEVVKQRYDENKNTNQRFDLPEDLFDKALNELEIPAEDEDVIIVKPDTKIEDLITHL